MVEDSQLACKSDSLTDRLDKVLKVLRFTCMCGDTSDTFDMHKVQRFEGSG